MSPSTRNEIAMTDDEVAAFLAEPRTMTLATHDHDGGIHLAAMWFVVDAGDPVLWTYARSQKAVNLRRDPRVTALVEAGTTYADLRGVTLVGTAELDADPAEVARVGALVSARYTGSDPDEVPDAVRRQAPKRVAIRIRVRRRTSWDHRRAG